MVIFAARSLREPQQTRPLPLGQLENSLKMCMRGQRNRWLSKSVTQSYCCLYCAHCYTCKYTHIYNYCTTSTTSTITTPRTDTHTVTMTAITHCYSPYCYYGTLQLSLHVLQYLASNLYSLPSPVRNISGEACVLYPFKSRLYSTKTKITEK